MSAPDESSDEIEVVSVDTRLIVVDKPAGLHCHPLDDAEEDTVLARVARRFPEVRGPEFPMRDGALLHRLDVGTSGLLALARDRATYDALRARFSHDLDDDEPVRATQIGVAADPIEKIYVALVVGALKDALVLDRPIAHHAKSKKKMVVVHARTRHRGHPRAARTVVVPLACGHDATLVAISLHGGRRHQIRAHLADAGHPLVGDVLYGAAPRDDTPWPLLHAAMLVIDDGRALVCAPGPTFTSALGRHAIAVPEDWRGTLESAFDRA